MGIYKSDMHTFSENDIFKSDAFTRYDDSYLIYQKHKFN